MMKAVEPGYVALATQKACHGLVLSQAALAGWKRCLGENGLGRVGRMDITRKYPSNSLEDKSSRC